MHEGQYLYCIIETGEARNFGRIGIGGRGDPVITIAYRDLSAVVSSVPMNKYVVSKETMIAHEKVIETVMKDYTVLPVRFYSVAPNAEEIRNLLRKRYYEFKKLLRELDNKVEFGLKAIWKEMDLIFKEIVEEIEGNKVTRDTVTAGLGEDIGQDKAALSRRVKLALEEKKAKEREVLLLPLRKVCSDFCLNTTYGDDMIMNAAFLVDRTREREFDSRVEELGVQYGERIEFKYVGPAPPYSFVNIVVK
ncbi:MAG: GvpL/GvpF family gas vesicle protein [Coprothermobacterota bacterium]|nr:GvpL/GvpF family gas vesicle protein [Coprothermobacterota bacterium]